MGVATGGSTRGRIKRYAPQRGVAEAVGCGQSAADENRPAASCGVVRAGDAEVQRAEPAPLLTA